VIEEINEHDVEVFRSSFPSRYKIPGFPLDHMVGCGHCYTESKVGFRQSSCPRCGLPLISPDKAKFVDGRYEEPVKKKTG
jgi:hypothetical protein